MAGLTPEDLALLSAMMATIGSIWAIGFMAFVLLYQNFSATERLPTTVMSITEYRTHGPADLVATYTQYGRDISPLTAKWERLRRDTLERLRRLKHVFEMYLAAGAVVFVSIVLSGAVIAFDVPSLVWAAGVIFVLALGMLVSALSYEIWTSIRYVHRLYGEIQKPL